jgi:hypothetical protein
MPAKPSWTSRYPEILQELSACEATLLDRHAVERLLCVRRRRAQQILAACGEQAIGNSAAVTPERLAAYLRCVFEEGELEWEHRRRHRVASFLKIVETQRAEEPQLLVEAPTQITSQRVAALPEGVDLQPGTIEIRFSTPEEGLEKLLALAMAIGNDLDDFRDRTALKSR